MPPVTQPLRFAIFGAGFWSQYQLAAWNELPGAQCVAVYNRTLSKAEALAKRFNISAAYDDPLRLLQNEELDFIDIITDAGSHEMLAELGANHGLAVICQKPMAPNLEAARRMVAASAHRNTPLYIHENWRWQRPIRALRAALDSRVIGSAFRTRIDYCNSFPVFDSQPFLKELEQFILTDIGTHILDVARFLFGEAQSIYCHTHRVRPDIRGEDAATTVMQMTNGATVTCNMSYASRLEHDRFPETFITVEGDGGSIELAPDYWLRVTTKEGTLSTRVPPAHYSWADPRYALVHSSIVDCNNNLLGGLTGNASAETTADDNRKTLELVFGAYDSAREKRVVQIQQPPTPIQ